jgi:UDP-N-acetylmuramate dehydrogenase
MVVHLRDQLQTLIKGKISAYEPMSRHTTWRIGGPADLFLQPEDWKDIEKALNFANDQEIPVTIIGGGSNLLIDDKGIRGLVIKTTGLNKLEFFNDKVKVGAGMGLPLLAIKSGQNGLTGLEFAASIPGTVGGAVLMNAGAHGGAMEQVVEQVTVMDRLGKIHTFKKEELDFKYRSSKLKGLPYIVLEVLIKLSWGEREDILKKISSHKMFRNERQPLKYPNAGSVFKNPPGDSAGRLIEQVGAKGWQVGKAQVSEQHANFIVNLGGATSKDILNLMDLIQKAVKKEYGVTLEPEIIFLGG